MEEFHRFCANHTNHQKSYYETNSALKFFRPFFLSFHQNTFLFHHPHKFTIQTKSSYFSFTYWSRFKQQKTGLWKFLWIKFDNLNNLKLVSAIKNRLALNHFLFDNMKKPNHNRNKKASWNAGAAHFDHFRSHSLKHSSKCNSLIMIWRYCFFGFLSFTHSHSIGYLWFDSVALTQCSFYCRVVVASQKTPLNSHETV